MRGIKTASEAKAPYEFIVVADTKQAKGWSYCRGITLRMVSLPTKGAVRLNLVHIVATAAAARQQGTAASNGGLGAAEMSALLQKLQQTQQRVMSRAGGGVQSGPAGSAAATGAGVGAGGMAQLGAMMAAMAQRRSAPQPPPPSPSAAPPAIGGLSPTLLALAMKQASAMMDTKIAEATAPLKAKIDELTATLAETRVTVARLAAQLEAVHGDGEVDSQSRPSSTPTA